VQDEVQDLVPPPIFNLDKLAQIANSEKGRDRAAKRLAHLVKSVALLLILYALAMTALAAEIEVRFQTLDQRVSRLEQNVSESHAANPLPRPGSPAALGLTK
jgi:hypothetical protein